jgi:hypothetical protein
MPEFYITLKITAEDAKEAERTAEGICDAEPAADIVSILNETQEAV